MKNPDNFGYLRFCGPQMRDKAIHTLEGLLKGMAMDGHFNEAEVRELKEWYSDNEHLAKRAPFSEILPIIFRAVEDGRVDREEYEDILWVLNNAKIENEYFDSITTDVQQLHGLLHGIVADQKIEKAELEKLHHWILDREELKGLYPYDEIESLITGVLGDGQIDAVEHEALLAFFEEFVGYSMSKRVSRAMAIARGHEKPRITRSGICAVDPVIIFSERVFVFTGISERGSRKQIAEQLSTRRAQLSESIPSAHYLVVGNNGNPAWAFACYGRKVERAMQLRKEGRPITIVNEIDFWDALKI